MNPRLILNAALLGALLATVACNTPQTHARRSSLMDYLYPKQQSAPLPNPAGARLKLPLKLGIAFVPATSASWRVQGLMAPGQEKPLLDVVKQSFRDKPWVADIKLVPSTYLRPNGGFDNLDQVARMYGVDVMALVSVDQIQYTDPKWYSFTYLSIVGAYVLPGDANDTRTLIDAAVYDVPSHTFLLRAPGQSQIKGSSTWAHREVQLRAHSQEGLQSAMTDLAKNLDVEVANFKAEIARGERKDVEVVDRQGVSLRQSGGRNFGGSFGWVEALGALSILGFALRSRRS
ncbi:rhombotarget lipoprotein [Geothrix limicola]|uniref:Rhombotarget lipoprotein n=1 Tax=Geothrix limicola TaxID=2927978 RepID=A0ABQ5QFL5_9BACT|nr:rhombotarget lipoprotein [Geothrix limicola]GLH73230.1 rhombotarget lipoprotein [Geothrix limicola]